LSLRAITPRTPDAAAVALDSSQQIIELARLRDFFCVSGKVCDRRAIKPRGGVALKDFHLRDHGA
jgi:hypothetical protein